MVELLTFFFKRKKIEKDEESVNVYEVQKGESDSISTHGVKLKYFLSDLLKNA